MFLALREMVADWRSAVQAEKNRILSAHPELEPYLYKNAHYQPIHDSLKCAVAIHHHKGRPHRGAPTAVGPEDRGGKGAGMLSMICLEHKEKTKMRENTHTQTKFRCVFYIDDSFVFTNYTSVTLTRTFITFLLDVWFGSLAWKL